MQVDTFIITAGNEKYVGGSVPQCPSAGECERGVSKPL